MGIWTHTESVSGSRDNRIAQLFEDTIDEVLLDPRSEAIEDVEWSRHPCIHCGGMLTALDRTGSHLFSLSDSEDTMVAELVVCQRCGWWSISAADLEIEIETENWYAVNKSTAWPRRYDRPSHGLIRVRTTSVSGCLARFGEPAPGLAETVEELQRLVLAKPEARFLVNPAKFERLVAQVLKDCCGCEVLETGGAHDGGIDLLLYEGPSNQISAVQVKRYRGTVGIRVVRELRGALLEKPDVVKGLIVTSSKFSRYASKCARLPGLKRIELIDGDRLLEMIGCQVRPAYCSRDLATAAFAEHWAAIGARLSREHWSESELPDETIEELAREADAREEPVR